MEKKSLLLFTLCALVSLLLAQPDLYNKSINFEGNNRNLIIIDSTQIVNIWQIGSPQKTIFDSAYSNPFAILTDTLNNYPLNNISSFQVKILPPTGSCWGTGFLSFNHKYDTEYGRAGGYIEVQYDGDTTWKNVLFDEEPVMGIWFGDFYDENDTISGNIPAFTGSSDGWRYSEIYWEWFIGVREWPYYDSLAIRFTFKSDDYPEEHEGWLIDNIVLALYECTGSIADNNTGLILSNVNPNPLVSQSFIEFGELINHPVRYKIFNMNGQLTKSEENVTSDQIVLLNEEFDSGMYFYQIIQNDKLISMGKFMVAK